LVRNEAALGHDRNPPALIPVLIAAAAISFAFRHLQAADLCAWRPGDRGIGVEEVFAAIATLVPRSAGEARERAFQVSKPVRPQPGVERASAPADVPVSIGPRQKVETEPRSVPDRFESC
jgi:hypothetical protein